MNRICCFYVNQEHLMSILLPYINEKLKENQNVLTILDEDIGKNLGMFKKSFNFTKEEWKKIENIGWRKEKNNNVKNEAQMVVLVGSDEFLTKKLKELENLKSNQIIITCYEMLQASNKIGEILEENEKILNTSGIKDIEEIFTGFTRKSYKEITIIK